MTLTELIAAATPGPWRYGTLSPLPNIRRRSPPGGWPVGPYSETDKQVAADAALIVAAVNALPALLAALKAADHMRNTGEADDCFAYDRARAAVGEV